LGQIALLDQKKEAIMGTVMQGQEDFRFPTRLGNWRRPREGSAAAAPVDFTTLLNGRAGGLPRGLRAALEAERARIAEEDIEDYLAETVWF
jgi:hypothetical protein